MFKVTKTTTVSVKELYAVVCTYNNEVEEILHCASKEDAIMLAKKAQKGRGDTDEEDYKYIVVKITPI